MCTLLPGALKFIYGSIYLGLSTVECNCKVTLTTASVLLCGNLLNRNKIAFLSSLPPAIHSLSDLTNFLSALNSAPLCIGNSEQSFVEVVKH